MLYRYPAFGRLWAGRLVSLFGDALTLIALPWFVLQVTGSGTATAGILLTLQLPAILTSLGIGSLIDRFQPRAIIAIDNGLRCLIIGLIPVLYWFGLLELWLLFLLTFLAGMLAPATEVGSRSILPDLVEDQDLDAANMLWSFNVNLALVVGPAVAGVLVASFGGPSVLLIDAGTFAVMALAAITLPRLKRSEPAAQAPLSERLGLRQLWQMKVVRYTTLLSLVFFFSYGPLEGALPLYSDAILQTDAAWLRPALVRPGRRRVDRNAEQYRAQQASASRDCLTVDRTALGRQPLADGFYQQTLVGLWRSFAGGVDVGTLYTHGDDLVAAPGSESATGQGVWGALDLAHGRVAPGFGRGWHPAGFYIVDQRDCDFGDRLYPRRFDRTAIASFPSLIASALSSARGDRPMKYMLLMYWHESAGPKNLEEQQAASSAWAALRKELKAAGVLLANNGLDPVANATTVRVRDARTLITDGPFAETHEKLGGYFLLECN